MYDVHCTYMFCTDCSGRGHWCSVVHLLCRLHNPTLSKIEVTTTRPVLWGDLGTILEIQCYDFAVCWLEWPDTNVCKKLICDAIWHPWTKHWRNLKSAQRQTLLLLSISLCQCIPLYIQEVVDCWLLLVSSKQLFWNAICMYWQNIQHCVMLWILPGK